MRAGHGDLLIKNAYGCLLLLLSQNPGVLRLFQSNLTLPCFVLPAAGREGMSLFAACFFRAMLRVLLGRVHGLHLIHMFATH